ncbi:MAG: 4,5-DOPA dioxygenase extradiol [Flavobacteriales bacterium]
MWPLYGSLQKLTPRYTAFISLQATASHLPPRGDTQNTITRYQPHHSPISFLFAALLYLMKRNDFLKIAGLATVAGATMKLSALKAFTNEPDTARMPVLFVGHGSPMNAIEENTFTQGMKAVAAQITKPTAILMVSAHWETRGTFLTAQEQPPTIHDFGGFPQALFDVQYPAKGSTWLAGEAQQTVTKTKVGLSSEWGLDHGCWSVAKNMWPDADVPIVQLSLDYTQGATYHLELAKELATLRTKGILIIGSGNMVHNLGLIQMKDGDINAPYATDWALEADAKFKELINKEDYATLANYKSLGKAVQLAVPTPEHFLPLLYALALKEKTDTLSYFNDTAIAGSLTMTSLFIKPEVKTEVTEPVDTTATKG